MSARAKVYRNVDRRQEWLGLEPFDWLVVATLGWAVMMLYRHALGLDLLVVASTWVGLRVLKRGKPPGYTGSLVRFYLVRKPFFSATAPDREVEAHPFRSQS